MMVNNALRNQMSVSIVRGQVSGDRRRVSDEDSECQGIGVTGYSWRGRVSKRRFGNEYGRVVING